MLSVVIPARNAASLLRGQLAALAAQTYTGEWEVVVADNGSTDDTGAVVRGASVGHAAVRLVDAPGPVATNRARNVGAAAARGEFVLFVDADDEVAPTWLEAMARATSRCDAVGGALERSRLNTASDVRTGSELSSDLQVWPGFLPYPNGANCGLRRSLFRELGGFDESYTAGGDDVELFWRLQLAGHQVCFVPDAVVSYRERTSLSELGRQFYRYGLQDPHLARDFRGHGMPPSGLWTSARSWGHLVLLAPWYWCGHLRRRQWVRSTARRVGRIAGSVRYRTMYL